MSPRSTYTFARMIHSFPQRINLFLKELIIFGDHFVNSNNLFSVSFIIAGLLIIRRKKKVKFRGIFGDKIAEKSVDFTGIFTVNLAGKQSVNKRRILWLFSGQISQEIDRFCADQTSIFNVFLIEDIICSFNNNTL